MVNPNISAPEQPSENDDSERPPVIVGFDDKTGEPILAPFEQVVGHAATTTEPMINMYGGYTGAAPSNNPRLVHVGDGHYVPQHLLHP